MSFKCPRQLDGLKRSGAPCVQSMAREGWLPLQLFTGPILWFEPCAGGRFFYTVPAWLVMAVYLAYIRVCLIFGGVSSAGILEHLAKIVLFIVVQK